MGEHCAGYLASKRTETICLVAVTQDGELLEYVPEPMLTEAVCLAAVRQNWRAMKWVPQELRLKVLKQDDTAEMLQRNSYNDFESFLSTGDNNEEVLSYLKEIQETLLKTCNTIIFQPKPSDYELEDIRQIYAVKHGAESTLYVRDREALSKVLTDLNGLGNKVNLALVGHASTDADEIAFMSPFAIASLASQHPIIKKITLLGCKTAAGKEYLQEEEKNAQEFLEQKELLKEAIRQRYPDIAFKQNPKRLDALVTDILWQDGQCYCGAAVMLKPESGITPKRLKQELSSTLDAAYVFIKSAQDNTYVSII